MRGFRLQVTPSHYLDVCKCQRVAFEEKGKHTKTILDMPGYACFKFMKLETSASDIGRSFAPYFYFSELFVSDYAEIVNMPCAKTQLGICDHKVGVISYDVRKNKDSDMLHFPIYSEILHRYPISHVMEHIDRLSRAKTGEFNKSTFDVLLKQYYQMSIFDSIFSHPDRHLRNFAYSPYDGTIDGKKTDFTLNGLYDNELKLLFCCVFENNLQGILNRPTYHVENDALSYGLRPKVKVESGRSYKLLLEHLFGENPELSFILARSILDKVSSNTPEMILSNPKYTDLPQEYKLALRHLTANNTIRLIDFATRTLRQHNFHRKPWADLKRELIAEMGQVAEMARELEKVRKTPIKAILKRKIPQGKCTNCKVMLAIPGRNM